MVRLVLIRHGATEGNRFRRYIGRTDEPLSEAGIAQLRKIRKNCPQIDRLYVSPMKRTRETAKLLYPDMCYTTVNDFRETDFGIFEGKTAAELSGNAEYQKWLDSFCTDAVSGGESIRDFKRRSVEAFRSVMAGETGPDTIGFVVHGGTIMAILEALALPHRDFYDYHIGNGEWVSCRYENGVIRDVRKSSGL